MPITIKELQAVGNFYLHQYRDQYRSESCKGRLCGVKSPRNVLTMAATLPKPRHSVGFTDDMNEDCANLPPIQRSRRQWNVQGKYTGLSTPKFELFIQDSQTV